MQPCWSTVSEWVSAFPLSNTKLFLYNKATARLISHLETGRQLPSQPCRWAFTTNWQFDADRWETEMNWNFSPMRVERRATMVGWLCALNHPSIVRDTVSQSLFLFVSVNGTVTLFTEWYKMQTKKRCKNSCRSDLRFWVERVSPPLFNQAAFGKKGSQILQAR